MMDARQGIDGSDLALYKWLTDEKLRIRGVETKLTQSQKAENQSTPFIKDDADFFNQVVAKSEKEELEVGKMPGMQMLDSRSRKKRRAAEREQEMKRNAALLQQNMPFSDETDGVEFSSKIPPMIFIANKCEDGFEGDVLSDFYAKFPEVTRQVDPLTG
jgi:hypothetical protein